MIALLRREPAVAGRRARPGQTDKTLAFTGSADETAQTILSTLEGAMLVARPYGDPTKFTATARQLLAGLAN